MLFGEAIIAELLGMALASYTAIKHLRGGEGFAAAAVICSLVVFVAIPVTKNFLG